MYLKIKIQIILLNTYQNMDRQLIGVFDADFIPFIACHNKKDTEEKDLNKCIEDCDNLIDNVVKAIKCDYFVGFLTKGKCFRYDIYPDYKGNRKYLDPPKFMNEVKDHLITKYNFVYNKEYEADDLVLSYKMNNPNYDCMIISPDKDILNLQGNHYNPRKGEIVFTSREDSELYFWKSMLIGDSADNIKGCKGIGPVSADKIIANKSIFKSLREEVLEQYCTIFGEREGIKQFYNNYYCLKIVDDIDISLLQVKLNEIKILSE